MFKFNAYGMLILDLLVLHLPLAQVIGRLANYFNQELYTFAYLFWRLILDFWRLDKPHVIKNWGFNQLIIVFVLLFYAIFKIIKICQKHRPNV